MNTNRKRFTTATQLALLCALLSGCVGTSYHVGVSGFTDPAYTGGRSYWLLPGMKGLAADDLEFREYAGYLRRGLSQSGFTEAPSFEQADLAIFVSYGVGDTREQNYSYSLPIYGQTGGGTYDFSGTTYSGTGAATTYGTIYQQPQYGIVGSQQISGTQVTHLRHLLVDALDLKAYRTDKKAVSVWRTQVLSRGTSADLRHVFPVLVVAATPHFGKNTKERVVLDISEGDKRLQQLRSGADK
jgi:hypothetical protein